MPKRLLLLGMLSLAATGCGSSSSTAPSTTSTASTTNHVSPEPTSLTVFRVVKGSLRAEVVDVPHTEAVATAALGALELPAQVTVAAGTASVSLDSPTDEQVAEIVYSLTRYPSIQQVDVGGRTGLTRADVSASFLPAILVESPGAGAAVPETFSVRGTASVFEATLVVELRRAASVVEKQSVTASEGAPGRGTFSTTLHAPSPGNYTLAAYAPSAADGTPQHQQNVPLTVTP